MAPEDESRVLEGFTAALAQPPENRQEFLRTYCGEDHGLRIEIEELLQHYHENDNLLNTPALELNSVRQALTSTFALTGRRVGAYEISERLGDGGMAVVYLGHRADGSFDKKVAIKVFDHFHSASSDEARFRQELRILGQLDTPYIAKIVDAGKENGLAYFVMEYVDGSHIDAHCREHNLSLPDKLGLFLKVCEAVSLAHNSNIVHRDLKPANILVDRAGLPKLIDFGIAKVLDAKAGDVLTVRGLEPMTLRYASPEQLSGSSDLADLPSSDIYSLGVLLFELLTGRRPIEPPGSMPSPDVPRFIIETEPEVPSKCNPSLDRDLDTIILKALRKDRRERYYSVEQFASYIRLYLENRPLPEGPPGFLYGAGKFVRRNRTPVAVSALLLATLLGGIVATERQKSIAERRFNDVRQLATSFLFEFDKAISNIEGATEARQLVVAKGLEYLDKLSRDSGSDDSLRDEIASAYERLAGIQGNVYGSNLGEYAKAAASYQRALTIRKELVAKHPGDPALMRGLGNSYLQLADGWFTKGNTKAAVDLYREGMKILAGLSQSGDLSMALRIDLQRGYSRLCSFLPSTGDHRAAIENCGNSVRAAMELVALNPANPGQRSVLAVAHGQMGNALRLDNRPKEAVVQLELAASEFQKLLSEQPENNVYARNLAGTCTLLGNSYAAVDQPAKAIETYAKGIDIVRAMIKADPADARPKITLAVSLIRLAAALLGAGRAQDAGRAGAEGLGIFRSFAERPQATPDDLNNYASFLIEISVPELRDPQRALAYSKRAVSAVKEPSLVFLSTLVDAYFAVGDLDNATSTAQRALDSNPAPKGGAEAGVRTDMERKLQKFQELKAQKGHSELRR